MPRIYIITVDHPRARPERIVGQDLDDAVGLAKGALGYWQRQASSSGRFWRKVPAISGELVGPEGRLRLTLSSRGEVTTTELPGEAPAER